MAKIFFDQDADLGHLKGRTVAILGYGNQGRAHSLNLRDSGVDVIVGSPEDASADQARADGFQVFSIAEASHSADVLSLLVPDEVMASVYEVHVSRHLRTGMVLNFASGYNITFKRIVPPEGVDVTLVAPRMVGKGVRDTYVRGLGFPSMVGVEQDASGHAWDMALAIAKGIGSTRMGAMQSSFDEETLIDLFMEHIGDMLYPLRLMFEVLVEAKCDPEVVVMELYGSGEMSELYAAARDMGLWGQIRLHSRTSQYGQQVIAKRFLDLEADRARLRRIVEYVQSGEFPKEWQAEQEAGLPNLLKVTNENLRHPMQIAENRLYRVLGRRDRDLVEAEWLLE